MLGMVDTRASALLAALGAGLLLGPTAAAQQGEPKPAAERRTVALGNLQLTLRSPDQEEIRRFALKMDYRPRGRVVVEVEADGAAARAGIAANDVIERLNHNELYSEDDVADFMRLTRPGQEVDAQVRTAKDGGRRTVKIVLGQRRQEVPERPALQWQYAGMGQLEAALGAARRDGKRVVVGLSGAET
jgi:S1-C subfamily serine protease